MSKYALSKIVDILKRRGNLDRFASQIVEAYEVDLMPVIAIAKVFKVCRQAVYKSLHKAGIDTTKKGGVEVSCSACLATIRKPRCQVRKAKHLFCDQTCYAAWLETGNGKGRYKQNRHGQRLGRAVVSKFIVLEEGFIVHHEDRNSLNNEPHNLKAFRNQGDHVRHHRDFEVVPVWDGALLPLNFKYPKKPKKVT